MVTVTQRVNRSDTQTTQTAGTHELVPEFFSPSLPDLLPLEPVPEWGDSSYDSDSDTFEDDPYSEMAISYDRLYHGIYTGDEDRSFIRNEPHISRWDWAMPSLITSFSPPPPSPDREWDWTMGDDSMEFSDPPLTPTRELIRRRYERNEYVTPPPTPESPPDSLPKEDLTIDGDVESNPGWDHCCDQMGGCKIPCKLMAVPSKFVRITLDKDDKRCKPKQKGDEHLLLKCMLQWQCGRSLGTVFLSKHILCATPVTQLKGLVLAVCRSHDVGKTIVTRGDEVPPEGEHTHMVRFIQGVPHPEIWTDIPATHPYLSEIIMVRKPELSIMGGEPKSKWQAKCLYCHTHKVWDNVNFNAYTLPVKNNDEWERDLVMDGDVESNPGFVGQKTKMVEMRKYFGLVLWHWFAVSLAITIPISIWYSWEEIDLYALWELIKESYAFVETWAIGFDYTRILMVCGTIISWSSKLVILAKMCGGWIMHPIATYFARKRHMTAFSEEYCLTDLEEANKKESLMYALEGLVHKVMDSRQGKPGDGVRVQEQACPESPFMPTLPPNFLVIMHNGEQSSEDLRNSTRAMAIVTSIRGKSYFLTTAHMMRKFQIDQRPIVFRSYFQNKQSKKWRFIDTRPYQYDEIPLSSVDVDNDVVTIEADNNIRSVLRVSPIFISNKMKKTEEIVNVYSMSDHGNGILKATGVVKFLGTFYLEHSGSTKEGSSGSPITNSKGMLIGMHQGSIDSLNYGMPLFFANMRKAARIQEVSSDYTLDEVRTHYSERSDIDKAQAKLDEEADREERQRTENNEEDTTYDGYAPDDRLYNRFSGTLYLGDYEYNGLQSDDSNYSGSVERSNKSWNSLDKESVGAPDWTNQRTRGTKSKSRRRPSCAIKMIECATETESPVMKSRTPKKIVESASAEEAESNEPSPADVKEKEKMVEEVRVLEKGKEKVRPPKPLDTPEAIELKKQMAEIQRKLQVIKGENPKKKLPSPTETEIEIETPVTKNFHRQEVARPSGSSKASPNTASRKDAQLMRNFMKLALRTVSSRNAEQAPRSSGSETRS
jgi:hypothetical protein